MSVKTDCARKACIDQMNPFPITALMGININSIAAQLGKEKALSQSLDKFDILSGINNKSLIYICQKQNFPGCF